MNEQKPTPMLSARSAWRATMRQTRLQNFPVPTFAETYLASTDAEKGVEYIDNSRQED